MVEGEGAVWAVYKDADPIPEGCTPDLLSSPRLVTGMKAMAPLSVGWAAEQGCRGRQRPCCRVQSCALPRAATGSSWQCNVTLVNAAVTPDREDSSDVQTPWEASPAVTVGDDSGVDRGSRLGVHTLRGPHDTRFSAVRAVCQLLHMN